MMFEFEIIKLINAFVGLSVPFDNAVYYLANFDEIKMLPMIVILIYLWSIEDGINETKYRQNIIKGIVGSFIAMFLTRVLAKTLPLRLRPLHEPDLLLSIPDIIPTEMLDQMSSMPSDHATLGFALATTIFFTHKKWGIFAYVHVFILVCLPRVYLSFHYPSDILVGSFIGIAVTYLALKNERINTFTNKIFLIKDYLPKTFYFFASFITFQFATMFNSARSLISTTFNYLKLFT